MLEIRPLSDKNHEWFIRSLQRAFKQAVSDAPAEDEEIISRAEIETSMQAEPDPHL